MLMEPLLQLFDARIRPRIENRDDIILVDTTFAEITTLHLGGRPAHTLRCTTREAVVEVVRLLDTHKIPLLIVGGGSNLVIADGDIPLVAVIVACDTVYLDKETGELEADAGAVWDSVVARSVEHGMGGIECLSGIPGSAGATPVQNVGAYGVEIADVLTEVELYHRDTGVQEWVRASDLELAYRYSNLKFTGRAVVLGIRLQLRIDGLSAPLRFGELARVLKVSVNEIEARRLATTVRAEVLKLRQNKGMVYDPEDHDTWSAGSFFTNPVVFPEKAETVRGIVEKLHGSEQAAAMPCFDVSGGQKKLSAAWLIDRAGFAKGYPENGRARISTKHTLALTNRGTATTEDLVELARTVRDGVHTTFGVQLEPEPVWIGTSL
ncbi:MAG: UDP-N-acetylmuramate dehydrogenase [Corynebacterium sp.]|nr:UDP-N-acetylmuramate dehydrogenase [Corynebacterium sp.]